MTSPSGAIMSKKIGKHKHIHKDLRKKLNWICQQEGVKRIILGNTQRCSHPYPESFLKIQEISVDSVALKGFSGQGITEIFVKIETEEAGQNIANKIVERQQK